MTSRPVKATEALEKPPAAKPFSSRWIPDEDPKPRVNVNYRKVLKQFVEYQGKKSPLS